MIEIDGLTKDFGGLIAVDNLSFSVQKGEVLGFLGPNGAGKSTTMKMLTGFLTPTSGNMRVGGFDIASQSLAARKIMGYLPEGAPGYGEMTVKGFLTFVAEIREIPKNDRKNAIASVVEKIELQSVLNQTLDTLSKGFRRRVGLAQSLLHDPQILILDEPTDGLDPNQKHQVRELIQSLSQDKTIVISTHILEEVSAVCSRAIIINKGKLVADDTPAELEARSRYHGAISLKSTNLEQLKSLFAGCKSVKALEVNEDQQRITLFAEENNNLQKQVNDMLAENNISVDQVYLEVGRLDEVFRNLTGATE